MPRSLLRALLLACVALMLGTAAAVAQTDDQPSLGSTDSSVIVGIQNDVVLAAGEESDAVFVVDGTARIEGSAKAVVAIDSDVTISGAGASAESVLAIGGTLDVADGATVNDLAYIGTTPTIAPTATITGEITNIETDLAEFAGFLLAALAVIVFFIFIGWLLAVLIAALLMVAFGTDQARRAAANIGGDVLKTLVVGLLMLIVPWIVIGLLAVTIVGIPLAIGLAIMWGLVAFLGYLVVGLWIGQRILSRSRTATRPYGAAVVGVLILILLSWVPLVSPLAMWFGLGAVTLAGWRTLRSGGTPPMAAGSGGYYGQTWQAPPPYGQPVYGQPPYGQAPYGQPPYGQPPYAPPPPQQGYAPPPQQGYWPPEQGGPPAGWPQG
jgi:hypothetical protein